MKYVKEIEKLQDIIRKFDDCEENKYRWSFWQTEGMAKDALARPLPKDKIGLPYMVDLDRSGYARALDFSLQKFYKEPESYLVNTLKIIIFRFTQFKDCTPISKTIPYFAGSGFEKSLFGYGQVVTEEDAWVGRESIIEKSNIENLKFPDFYENPVMEFTRDFCEKMQEMLDDDFKVEFPQWNRSSWGLAWHLRGIDNLLIDYIEDPEWTKEFLDFLNKARMNWAVQRSQYLNEPLVPGSLYNDEVTVPIVSPNMYKDLIFQTEVEISKFYGGMNYWHSCGNTTPLMKMINTIPNLKMVHISPWSDLQQAVDSYSSEKVLQISTHPYNDIIQPKDEKAIEERLISIKNIVGDRKATISVDAVQIVNNVQKDLDAVKTWINHANKTLI